MRTLILLILSVSSWLSYGDSFPGYKPWTGETSSQRHAEQAARQIALAGGAIGKSQLDPKRPIRGKIDAPIQVLVFSDFQCPFCRNGYQTLQGLHAKYKDRLVSVFKHFPLPNHALALPAARRYEAIALISPEKAIRFHDILFEKQNELFAKKEEGLDQAAKEAGVSLAELKKKLKDPSIDARIKADVTEASSLGISGTPSFSVNGVLVRGAKAPEFFDELIQQLEAQEKPAATTEKAQ